MAGMAQTTSDGLSRSEIQPELSYANLLSSKGKPKLEVCNLFKSYGKQGKQLTVLENVNLQLYPRELVCIVGASGCGKSTLLNIIAGLVPPTSGEVRVDNDVILGPGSDRGMVFQGYTLYPWLTVAQNIGFGSKVRSLSKEQRKQRIGYFLEVVGLTRFANAYPKQLSGGMKQRVAIARALANEPEVLLMDEPFGALDAQTKEQMQQFLLELWEQTHTTILMITHDVEEAVFLSQRLYVMSAHPGKIKEEIAIALPEKRDVEIKLEPEFIGIKRHVVHALRDD
jgi:ABC-type nitrate/sulfonate/bicarbonate transport system ATPase subunit